MGSNGFASRWSRFPAAVRPDSARATQPQTVGPPAPAPADSMQISRLPVWIEPPSQWENVDLLAYALLPAIGATVTILTYTVPIGRNGVIQKVANNFVGGGWTAGTGDLVWRILVDGAPPPGATNYDTILDSLGSPALPTKIAGFRIFENQTITVVLFNNPGGPDGGVIVAGQRTGARLLGYLYPREYEEDDIWV
jgi:hypothetical protein